MKGRRTRLGRIGWYLLRSEQSEESSGSSENHGRELSDRRRSGEAGRGRGRGAADWGRAGHESWLDLRDWVATHALDAADVADAMSELTEAEADEITAETLCIRAPSNADIIRTHEDMALLRLDVAEAPAVAVPLVAVVAEAVIEPDCPLATPAELADDCAPELMQVVLAPAWIVSGDE